MDLENRDWEKLLSEIDIKSPVRHPLLFKARLGIGEESFASLRLKRRFIEAWDVGGAGVSGAAVASSPIVASTFFPSGGILGFFGLASTTTPVGWVIAAGLLSGAAWYVLRKWLLSDDGKIIKVPKYINSPLDTLSVSLFGLQAPILMRVAAIDGHVDDNRRRIVESEFVEGWGYHEDFVDAGLCFIEDKLEEFDLPRQVTAYVEFVGAAKDCDLRKNSDQLLACMRDIIGAGDTVSEDARNTYAEIEALLAEQRKTDLSRFRSFLESTWVDRSVNRLKNRPGFPATGSWVKQSTDVLESGMRTVLRRSGAKE